MSIRTTSRKLSPALDDAQCSAFWYCYNDGSGNPRHAWLHCRFELECLDSEDARALRAGCSSSHIFVRFDLTRVGVQEHWSGTDPSAVLHGAPCSDRRGFTECVRAHPGLRLTRGGIKHMLEAAAAQLPRYSDAGVEADGRWEPGCGAEPTPGGRNNCVTFARHSFDLVCNGSSAIVQTEGRGAARHRG